MLEERGDARVVVLEELGHELRVERQVEDIVQRILGKLRDRHAVALDLRPVAVEQDARLWVLEILPQAVAKTAVAIDRRAFFRRRRFDAVESIVRIEEVRLAQREVERQWLAARMDVHLVPACERGAATLVVLPRAMRVRL